MPRKHMDAYTHPPFTRRSDGGKMPDDTGWQDRHMRALRLPSGAEIGINGLIAGWASYADRHYARYGSGVGDDGVLGPAWAQVGAGIRRLLNGETGRFDCGTLDGFICDSLAAEGFDPDKL